MNLSLRNEIDLDAIANRLPARLQGIHDWVGEDVAFEILNRFHGVAKLANPKSESLRGLRTFLAILAVRKSLNYKTSILHRRLSRHFPTLRPFISTPDAQVDSFSDIVAEDDVLEAAQELVKRLVKAGVAIERGRQVEVPDELGTVEFSRFGEVDPNRVKARVPAATQRYYEREWFQDMMDLAVSTE